MTWAAVAVGIVCQLVLTNGQSPPYFSKLQDGNVHVSISDFPGLTKLTVEVSGANGQRTAYMAKTVVGDWQTRLPDVTNGDDDTVNYVIRYEGKNYAHETIGSTRLADKARQVRMPVTRRYLERRTTTVLHDDFTSGAIDLTKWRHAATGWGGGNHEFNMYTPEPTNSYIKNNMLYIRPTLTVDHFGDDYLTNGHFDANEIWGECSSLDNRGCQLSGPGHIPPIMSAMLISKAQIRYGKVTVVANLPTGDWLWPAIWLLPTEKHYGNWPRSGEIDIMESRGNVHYHQHWAHQVSMGTDYTHAAFHYGPRWDKPNKRSQEAEYRITGATFANSFHSYWMDWTADYIRLGVDDHTMLAWDTPAEGYWQQGQFQGDNIWAAGGRDAPFDRPFHLILNVAVGGGWFWELMENAAYPQPWQSNATKAEQYTQFWNARHLWEPTWHGENVAMKVRSVTMEQY